MFHEPFSEEFDEDYQNVLHYINTNKSPFVCRWNYHKYYCKLIYELLQKYNKLFLSIYDITEEELNKILITDDLCTNIILIKDKYLNKYVCKHSYHNYYIFDSYKDMFYENLYQNLFLNLGFDMIRDIITILNYDFYIDLIKIIRSIVIYECCKTDILEFNELGINFIDIFRYNNLSFFTILYQFVNDKDKEYKLYDLSGNIIYTFDFNMIKTINDLIVCISILNDRFIIIIDGNTFKSSYDGCKYIYDFPDDISPLIEITDIKDKMIQIIIHQLSDSDLDLDLE